MKAAIYKVTTDSGVMYISANLAEASAPIRTYFGTDPLYDESGLPVDNEGCQWGVTPFQTADAHHRESEMADLVAGYCDLGEVLKIE
jgi:hypothetical protein